MGGLGLAIYIVQLVIVGTDVVEMVLRAVRTAIFYPKGAMWFVAACIISSFILEIVLKKKINRQLVTVAALGLFGFALLANTYYFLLEGTLFQKIIDLYLKICMSPRNGVFLFIYLWLGYLLADDEIYSVLNIHKKAVMIIFIGSMITLIGEIVYAYGKNVGDDSSLFLSFIVFIPLLVYELLSHQMKINLPYKNMRKLSTSVYYLHPPINILFDVCFDFSGVWQFVAVSSACLLISFMVGRSSNVFLKKILE